MRSFLNVLERIEFLVFLVAAAFISVDYINHKVMSVPWECGIAWVRLICRSLL